MYKGQAAVYARAEVMFFVLASLYPPISWSPSDSEIMDVLRNPLYFIDATQKQ